MSDLKIFAKTIEEKAKAQIDLLLAQKPFESCKIRIMPDVHAGAGCVIGFTADLGDKVIPNIVGVDIGCGMLTVELGRIEIDYHKLDEVIRKNIPSGMNVHESYGHYALIDDLICYKQLKNIDRLHASLGTLGGGNHFIEIDTDQAGVKYLIIHTGSRNLGKQVAEIYQNMAIHSLTKKRGEDRGALVDRLKAEGRSKEIAKALVDFDVARPPRIPKELCYLEGKERDDYLYDMKLCQTFARYNRDTIADTICRHMGWISVSRFHTVHNYIDNAGMVRKGAISAKAGQIVLIPINMRDGCLVARGLGNKDWNESAPHGAGRIMSRAQAKREISMSDYCDSMEGIYTTSVSCNTLDEAPQAYKPMQEIVDCIEDTVDIIQIIKPTYNFKAEETRRIE